MKPSILLVPLAAVAMRLSAEQAFTPPSEVRQIALADVLNASASATSDAYPDADTIVIDSVSCEAYNEDGTSVLFDDTYTKVLTEKGRRAESTSSIGFNAFYTDLSIVAAEIIKPDGTTIPIDLERNCQTSIDTGMMSANIYDPDDKVTTVSFPNLEIGDMTRLAIVKTEKKARVPGVWADYQTFELFDPILRYTYSISCPTNLPVRSIVLRDEVPGTMVEREPVAIDGGARILRAWDIANVPQTFAEPSMPPLHTVCQRLLLSTAADWRELSRWYWNLCKPHLDATTDEMAETVKELVSDTADEREKIWRLFTWVSQNVRYMGVMAETEAPGYEPHDSSLTFGRRHGVCRDKAALLATMLRLAGIDAYPVLIHVGEKRDPDVPMTFFNHAVVGVRDADGAFELMDPTNENSADLLPAYLAGKSYLVATPEGETLHVSDEVPAAANMLFAATKASVDAHGKITASTKFDFTGLNDSAYRGMLVRMPAERRREFLESVAKRTIPGAKLESFSIEPENLRDTETPLSIRMKTSAADYPLRGDGATIIDIPRFSSCVGYVNFILDSTGLEKRRFPLETEDACGVEESVEIDFEALADPIALPDNESFKTNGVTFSRSVFDTTDQQTGHRVLKSSMRFELNLTSYPASIYVPFKETLHSMEQLSGQLCVFGQTPTAEEISADSRIISAVTEYHVDSPTAWTKEVTIEREVLTYAGRRTCSELKIPFNPVWQSVEILKASVSDEEGHVQLATDDEINVMDADWVASAPRYPPGKTMVVSLPGVEVGSTVTTSYRITQTYAPFFSHLHVFNGTTPRDCEVLAMHFSGTALERLNAMHDAGKTVVKTENRDALRYSEETGEDGSLAIMAGVMNPPTLPHERDLPDCAHYAIYSDISLGDWDEYAEALRKTVAEATSPANTKRCAELAATLCGEIDSVEDKIVAIRDYVARNIRLDGPSFTSIPLAATPADVTLADGYGNLLDRAVLISALLLDAGIDNQIVFAADDDLEETIGDSLSHNLELPHTWTFDYPLVEIQLDEEEWPIYLNDTDQYSTLGTTSHFDCLALTTVSDDPDIGLAADDEDGSVASGIGPVKVVGMDESLAPNEGRTTEIDLKANGDATIKFTKIVDGVGSGAFLKRYAEMTPELMRRHHQELAGAFSVTARPVGEIELSTNSLPYSITFSAEVPGFAKRTGNILSLPIPHLSSIDASDAEERRLPFALERESGLVEVVTVTLPTETSRVLTKPEPLSLKYSDIGFSDIERGNSVSLDEETERLQYAEILTRTERSAATFGPEFHKMLLEIERKLSRPESQLLAVEIADGEGEE